MSESRWRPWLGRVGAFVLGAVLLVATVAKALDPRAFGEQMALEGLTFGLPPMAAALLALALEGGLGLALVLGIRRWPVLAAAAALVVFFVFLNARAWWLAASGAAPEGACGCFGNLVVRSPQQAFWQDVALLVPALLLAFVGRPRRQPWPRRRMVAAAVGTAAVVLLAWRAPELPLDDLATRLRPGVELASLCAAGDEPVCLVDLYPELAEGRRWVVLVDVEDDPGAWVDGLNALASAAAETPVLALTASSSDAVRTFTWEWGPSFDLREAPAALLRPLHRRLPRSFLTDDGRVVATTPGLPPLAAAAQGEPSR